MMIDIVKQQREAMRAQVEALESELARLTEQLSMSRGALQMLDHVLTLAEAGDPLPAPVEGGDDARS